MQFAKIEFHTRAYAWTYFYEVYVLPAICPSEIKIEVIKREV